MPKDWHFLLDNRNLLGMEQLNNYLQCSNKRQGIKWAIRLLLRRNNLQGRLSKQ